MAIINIALRYKVTSMDIVNLNQFVTELMNTLNSELFWIGFKLMVGAVIVLLLKDMIQGTVSYILFRLDPYVGLGTPVELYGDTIGRICDASMFTIVIETEKGYIRLPTRRWRLIKCMVLKDRFLREKEIDVTGKKML